MANRSDFSSILPRRLKKIVALTRGLDEHSRGQMIRDFIGAHAYHKEVVKKRLSTKTNVDEASVEPAEAAEAV